MSDIKCLMDYINFILWKISPLFWSFNLLASYIYSFKNWLYREHNNDKLNDNKENNYTLMNDLELNSHDITLN